MTAKSPEEEEAPARGGGKSGEREAIAEGATLSPDSLGGSAHVAGGGGGPGGDGAPKIADDVFLAVGKRPFAAPPSPGTE